MPVNKMPRPAQTVELTANITACGRQLKNIQNWIHAMPTDDIAAVVERADKEEESQTAIPQFFEFLLECIRLNTLKTLATATTALQAAEAHKSSLAAKPVIKKKKSAAKKRAK